MASVERRNITLTKRFNNIFRNRRHVELYSYGLYTPPPVVRVPSDAPPPTEESSDLSVPFKTIMVPVLNEDGTPMLDKHGQPIMRKKKVPLTPEELDAQREQIEAEKKRKEEEERLKREEEERQAKLAKMREENMKVFKEVTKNAEHANIDQAAEISRKMGFAPTAVELLAMQEKLGDSITYDQMLDYMSKEIGHAGSTESLIEFFQAFDKRNTGFLSRAQIQNLLKNFGEPLTDEEVNELLQVCNCGDPVNYTSLVEQLVEFEM